MLYTLIWQKYRNAMYLGVYDSEEKALEIVAKDIAKRKFDEEIEDEDLQFNPNKFCVDMFG